MPDSEWPAEPDWKKRYEDAMERLSQMRVDAVERHNEYGNTVYRLRMLSTRSTILRQACAGTLKPDWRDRLTTDYYAALLDVNPGYQIYSDIDTLLVSELRSTPVADWEPGAGVGWRRALESWRDASHDVFDRSLAIRESVQERGRDLLAKMPDAQAQVDAVVADLAARGLDPDRGLEIIVLHERDVSIEALYRAGLCAGGETVDWRAWLRERVTSWPECPTRTTVLAELEDPHYHDDWEMLPDYWQ